ncbi:phosphoribosylglycinamide formyltransferase [Pontimonas salivibrio]|uniref:Phosphoribosylglycinamide formyltransferase n=1 Tax=Pontimonas salivibrio TaxID=1159327 RepID=A0A2L2BNZ8_9MICO|nr:phosphoribosylglycinamide formyltransferase [Pontimonas salivibrio]AVG23368.1 phosphoribosylglycinamide formyltransferase [Pontimonas salivibrio]
MVTRLVVLISGSGSNLLDLLERCEEHPEAGLTVVAVGADCEAAGLDHARSRNISTFVVPLSSFSSREEWGENLGEEIEAYSPDVVVLSGFMKLLPPGVVGRFAPGMINTHPAYLPEFPGAHAVADQIRAGVNQAGASVISVDDGVDTGPILARQRVPVEASDSVESLHDRIKIVERQLLWQVLTQGDKLATVPQGEDSST